MTPEDREAQVRAAMTRAYSPERQYRNWLATETDNKNNALDDIGVNEAGQLTGGGQLGTLKRSHDIGLARLGEDEAHTNLMTRGNYGARGLYGSGLFSAKNRMNRRGYARQRDDISLNFSDQSTKLLKQARDLVHKFGVEERQRYSDYELKTPLNNLGYYSF